MTNTLGSTLTQEEYLPFMMFGEGGNAADYRSVINTTMNELMNGILLQAVSLVLFRNYDTSQGVMRIRSGENGALQKPHSTPVSIQITTILSHTSSSHRNETGDF